MMKPLSTDRRALLARMLQEKGLGGKTRQVIPRRAAANEPIPSSLNQEGLWFIEQLSPGQAHYNIPGAVRLTGRLEISALEKSLSLIIARHEALRTTFAPGEAGRPVQMVQPVRSITLPITDLGELSEEEREREARRLAEEEARRPFDLATGPLFRAFLIRLSDETHILVFNIHHIVSDGWSMGIFTQELTAAYQAYLQGQTPELTELPIQYGDYAAWQRQHLQEDQLAGHRAFWQQTLAGAPERTALKIDLPRPAVQSFQGGHQAIHLSPELTTAVRTLAQQLKSTPFVILSAAFRTVLVHHTGQRDLVLGATFANREQPELAGLIGFFVNTLPLRTDFSANPTFKEMLDRVREASLAAHEHQELPLARLVKELKIERSLSYNPIFQVVFDLLTPDRNPAVYGYGLATAIETLALPGLTMTPLDITGSAARFDLTVIIWDMPAALAGVFEYDAALFKPATIERLIRHFELVLARGVAQPDLTLAELLALLQADDREQAQTTAGDYRKSLRQKLKSSRRRTVVKGENH